MDGKELMALAERARANAYAPYSHFRVGAALLCEDGTVVTGCNVENASFTPTCCAERVAVFSACNMGKRRFTALAVAGGREETPEPSVMPCGVCRQVLAEFCSPDFPIYVKGATEEPERLFLRELLPHSFSLSNES